MTPTHRAVPLSHDIAAAIVLNCEAYNAGTITRAAWDTEQSHLWQLAADACCAQDVLRLVCPSLTGRES